MTQEKKSLPLYLQILFAILAGVVVAIVASQAGFSWVLVDWVKPFGDIFIRLLKMIAVPLVLFSIIKGIMSLGDPKRLGRLLYKTVLLYLATTILAISLGMVIANLVGPGEKISSDQRLRNRINYELWADEALDGTTLDGKDFIHDPEFAATVETILEEKNQQSEDDLTVEERKARERLMALQKESTKTRSQGPLQPLVDLFPDNIFQALGNNKLLLQIIFFGIFAGICLLLIKPESAEPIVKIVDGGNDLFLKMIEVIMRGAPFFVFALLAGGIADIAGDNPDQVGQIFEALAWYTGAVAVGLGLMILVYPVLASIFGKGVTYSQFLNNIRQAQILAFSTSSSAATLPVTMDCVENKIGVSKRLSSFVLPVGATVNMDGTSLYQTVAVIFLVQFHMVELDTIHYLIIGITTILASIGSAAVPGAGLVMLLVVLETLGLPGSWILIILPIDRLLDMIRTVVNVTGDATVATIVASQENELRQPS